VSEQPPIGSEPPPVRLRYVLAFSGLALCALAIALAVGWIILQYLPILMANQMGAAAYFVLLIILSLAAAIVLFGVLRATASLRGSHFGYTIELGGPAAIFILILLYGITQVPPAPSDFALTFRFRPFDHRNSMLQTFGEDNVRKAKVVLFLPNDKRESGLNGDGYAKIENIPARYGANQIEFDLRSDHFLVKDKETAYPMPTGIERVLVLDVIPIDFGPTKPEKPPVVPQTSRAVVINPQLTGISSGGTSDGHSPYCQRRTVQQCVSPQRPNSHLVVGSGSVTNEARVGRAGWTVVKDTPEQICIEFWAATGACETLVSIKGQATAVEEFTVQN
jgi:hypothetical protein